MLFTSRPRFTPLCLLLFSDLLLITQPKRWVSGGREPRLGWRGVQPDPCSASELPLPWAVGSGYRFWTTPIALWSRPSRFQTHLGPRHSASPFSATTKAAPPTGYSKLRPCELRLFQKIPLGPLPVLSEPPTSFFPKFSPPQPLISRRISWANCDPSPYPHQIRHAALAGSIPYPRPPALLLRHPL